VSKGYLIVYDVSLDEAKKIIRRLRKRGQWLSEKAMKHLDEAASFAITTHGYPLPPYEEMISLKEASE